MQHWYWWRRRPSIAPTHADPAYDQIFIDYLDKKGVPYKNRTQAIRLAKEYCLDQTRQGSTQTEAVQFVEGAIPIYCPKLWE